MKIIEIDFKHTTIRQKVSIKLKKIDFKEKFKQTQQKKC